MTFISAPLLRVGAPIGLSWPLRTHMDLTGAPVECGHWASHSSSISACRRLYGLGGVSFIHAGVPSFTWRRPDGLRMSLWHVGTPIGIRGLPPLS